MTVIQLIRQLEALNPNMEVKCWDGCEDEWNRVPVENVVLIFGYNKDGFVMMEG